MYDYSHQWIGNPLKFRQAHLEPLWERASSKLEISVSALLYVATKPKARFHKGFLLCALPNSCGTSVVNWYYPVTRASQSGEGGLRIEPGGRDESFAYAP
jgi:hypothetical protein